MQRSGFTLVEMAIVMVILSLLVAGILASRELIRAAEIRSVISTVNSYRASIQAFDQQYNALPGDMRNAYDYFDGSGGVAVCGADAPAPAGCNGNGNGLISTAVLDREDFRVWQHLALAEMIQGNFTGVTDSGDVTIDVNVPAASLDASGYWLRSDATLPRTDNFLQLGREENNGLFGSVLSAQDASSLDAKVDDGLAEAGNVRGVNGFGSTDCLIAGTGTAYDLRRADGSPNEDIACSILFYLEE